MPETTTNLKTIADKLNQLNLQYREVIPKEIIQEAKDNNIVILYGASDDLAEFEGAVDDEILCYNGGLIVENPEIIAKWYKDNIAWQYQADIPHEKFFIWEDEGKYCEGIVFEKTEDFRFVNT